MVGDSEGGREKASGESVRFSRRGHNVAGFNFQPLAFLMKPRNDVVLNQCTSRNLDYIDRSNLGVSTSTIVVDNVVQGQHLDRHSDEHLASRDTRQQQSANRMGMDRIGQIALDISTRFVQEEDCLKGSKMSFPKYDGTKDPVPWFSWPVSI